MSHFERPREGLGLEPHITGELTWKEIRLEQSREIGVFQRYRYTAYCMKISSKQRPISEQSFKKKYTLKSNARRAVSIAYSPTNRPTKASKRNSNPLKTSVGSSSKNGGSIAIPSSKDITQGVSISGDHTQGGICIEALSKIALADKAVVLGAADAV
ncbi:hypothetical protein N7508_009334 [Penicillium antarcticum]|uniref:uncharacterized protein n=1 Tax=Penicillium antarcticum TaxID=416450 RepID=UPI0023A59433|nr:uncharacterized protein N7508_009334 [Penicillium antarcticum]KAJ5294513.1 hypothetical protein N7508_009334 [Penicillium antarcticum]